MPKPFTPSSSSAGSPPLTRNHSNGENQRLVFQPETISVRQTWGTYSFALLLAGLFICILFIGTEGRIKWPLIIIGSLLELIPLAIIVNRLLQRRNLPVFDSLNKQFYPQGTRHPESAVSTKDIDHLQIIQIDLMRGCCYELNAVMKDGNRLHIMADGIQQKFIKEARQLADRLSLSLKNGYGEDFVYDPKQDTGPLVPGGSSFQISKLVFRQDSIAVRKTWKFYLFISFFTVVFLAITISFIFDNDTPWFFIAFITVGEVYLLGLFIHNFTQRSYPLFDMVDGMFYPKGFTRDGSGISLKQLDYLQIITERCHEKNNSYDSYELNIVLKDGSRYNIMDHGARKLFMADAKLLSQRLAIPLIDTTTGEHITFDKNDFLKEDIAPMTKGSACFLVIFGLIFFTAGCFAFWMICIRPISGWLASACWTPCEAKVISSDLARSRGSRSGTNYRIQIQYTYQFNGTTYTGSRYDFFRSQMSSNIGVGTMRKIVSDHSEGKEITCLVNPKNPHESVISRDLPIFSLFFMLFPLPFLGIGLFTFITVIRTLRAQKVQADILKQLSENRK
ncbi:MAG: DUF3592 domain-containing protein [Victivallales bacterium]|nr:DUF3592 domain-containing protein [Victivallales bacterium]